jgi:hypothetical protein
LLILGVIMVEGWWWEKWLIGVVELVSVVVVGVLVLVAVFVGLPVAVLLCYP